MTATATLVHTSSTAADNAERIARVAAAGRVERARIAAEYRAVVERARAEAAAEQWVADIVAEGAIRIGFKWCLRDGGKWRDGVLIEHAAEFMARAWGEDIEAWGLTAEGEYCPTMW